MRALRRGLAKTRLRLTCSFHGACPDFQPPHKSRPPAYTHKAPAEKVVFEEDLSPEEKAKILKEKKVELGLRRRSGGYWRRPKFDGMGQFWRPISNEVGKVSGDSGQYPQNLATAG